MNATPSTADSGEAASMEDAMWFDAVRFEARCAELGAETEADRAALTGTDRKTLWRYRNGVHYPGLYAAIRFADSLGLAVSDLWRTR